MRRLYKAGDVVRLNKDKELKLWVINSVFNFGAGLQCCRLYDADSGFLVIDYYNASALKLATEAEKILVGLAKLVEA